MVNELPKVSVLYFCEAKVDNATCPNDGIIHLPGGALVCMDCHDLHKSTNESYRITLPEHPLGPEGQAHMFDRVSAQILKQFVLPSNTPPE